MSDPTEASISFLLNMVRATLMTDEPCFASKTTLLLSMFLTWMMPLRVPKAMILSFPVFAGANVTLRTPLSSGMDLIDVFEFTSQTLTVPSSLALTKRCMSLWKSMHHTGPLCSLNVAFKLPSTWSKTRIWPSSRPTAMVLPSAQVSVLQTAPESELKTLDGASSFGSTPAMNTSPDDVGTVLPGQRNG